MVHSGDKLNEIAFYFGVTMKSIWAMNPWLHESTKIATGEILRLPPPTK
jgi:LysM repeat protein